MFPERVPKYKPPTDIPEWNFKQFYCHLPGAILAVYCIHFGLSLWGGGTFDHQNHRCPLVTSLTCLPSVSNFAHHLATANSRTA